jgi:FtsH-binding integral membrane protein
MLYGSIALFAIAAVFGLIILIRWLQKKDASSLVIYTHGILAAVALVLVIIYSLQNPNNFPKVSLILFVIAAVFGFYMFFRDLMKKMSPMAVAVIHALIAVSGFVGLLLFAIG